jgi:hypothetical protein
MKFRYLLTGCLCVILELDSVVLEEGVLEPMIVAMRNQLPSVEYVACPQHVIEHGH